MAVQTKRVPREEARVGPADAKAYELAAGECVQIEDLQGCQVSDFLAFHRDRRGLGISTTVTRALVDGLFPLPGQGIFDEEGNKLLTLIEDTVGRHDTFGIACNREYYESLGYPDHINCTDNFNRELAAFGYEPRRFWEPINFFYNTRIGADGRVIEIEPALSKAGDYVLMRASGISSWPRPRARTTSRPRMASTRPTSWCVSIRRVRLPMRTRRRSRRGRGT